MFQREELLSLKHVRTVMVAKMKPMKPEMMNDVNIPSGGRLGSLLKKNWIDQMQRQINDKKDGTCRGRVPKCCLLCSKAGKRSRSDKL